MSFLSRKRLILVFVTFGILATVSSLVFQVRHKAGFGHFAPIGLHVDAVSVEASIAIPGQTHLYWAVLTNFGWPVRFVACDYLTDAFQPGTDYAYGIQRWDVTTHGWTTVALPDPEWFCRPAPLSRIKADSTRRFVWPWQSVRVMDFEAVGARDEFRQGDAARFVVFRAPVLPVDWDSAVISRGFRIEDNVERPTSVPFRIRH